MSETIQYYDKNAGDYFDQTVGLDLAHLRKRFTQTLPPGARILDAGCGSGRDARAFLDEGFEVVAIDASSGMADQARRRLGIEVEVMPFETMTFREEFDGIWACASLLHVPSNELPAAVGKMVEALKPGGALYLSFKRGEAEEPREGRWFRDMTQQGLVDLLTGFDALELIETWESADEGVGSGGAETVWVNGLARRRS